MPNEDALSNALQLLLSHQWMGAAILFIGLFIRLFKEDEKLIPWSIPEKYRTWVALGLGALLGVLKAIATGTSVQQAVLQGLSAALMEIIGYHALVRPLSPSGELWTFKPADGSGGSGGAAVLLLAAGLSFSTTSCAQLHQIQPLLADAAIIAQNASGIIQLIENAERGYFALQPNPKLQTAIEKGLDDCTLGLLSAESMLHGAKDLDQAKIDDAFKEFRDAYGDLYQLLIDAGIYAPDGHPKATRSIHAYVIPKPIAVGR